MLRTNFRHWKRVFIGLTVLLAVSAQWVWGYEERGRQRREEPDNSRQEQLRQEAQSSAADIKAALTDILQQVNKNQDPEAAVIEKAATLLEDNKRFAIAYDEDQKAEYMLLQAWTEFYQDKPLGALNWSLRACKTDEASQDVWISQALFSLLSGKRPLEPRIQRPERGSERDMETNTTRRPRPRANAQVNNGAREVEVEPYSRKGTLNFDLLALRGDMLKERFSRVTYKTVDGSTVEYKPGEDTLCLFFWQAESVAADANDLSVRQGRQSEVMNNGGNQDPQRSLEAPQKYINQIFSVCKEQSQITCLQLNTNDRRTAEQLAAAPAKTGSGDAPPLVYAANPDSGAVDYIGVEAQIPFLLIADNKGVVRYAGPAADFMPAFILSHLTGVEIPLGGASQNGAASPVDMLRRDEFEAVSRGPRVVLPTRLPEPKIADPNKPAADPNAISAVPMRESKPAEKPEMTLEDQVAADKLLALAQMEIEACRKIRGKSPVQGVDACKEVLEKYPGTTYAEQAREQLRRVPQRYWEKYGIADLLGY